MPAAWINLSKNPFLFCSANWIADPAKKESGGTQLASSDEAFD